MIDMFAAWEPGQHMVVLGETGAGKTKAVKWKLLPTAMQEVHRLLIVDVEEGYDFPEPIFRARPLNTALTWARGDKPFIARVEFDLGLDKDGHINSDVVEGQFNLLAGSLLDRGGHDLVVYVDEASHFSPHGMAFPSYDALMTRARKRRISVVSGCQRPQLLSKTVYTQSVWKWWFYTDRYDVEGWLQRSATPVFERMNDIPFQSYRSLLQEPGGHLGLWEPVREYDWSSWK
jgi:hypothetical protein